MKTLIKHIIFTIFFLTSLASVASAETFTIMTEEYPPLNYTENGKLTGLSSDVVTEMLKRLGQQGSIKVLPWSRAYNLIQTKGNHVLFSMVRNEKRENIFKWVGPISSDKMVFFAKKGSDLTINSIDDAKKVKKIGTYKDSALEIFLKENGFKNFESIIDDSANVKKLGAGRIDLWIANYLQGIQTTKKIAGDSSAVQEVFEIKTTEFYIAFSKSTPDDVIAKWQKVLDEIKNDGTFDNIKKKYQ